MVSANAYKTDSSLKLEQKLEYGGYKLIQNYKSVVIYSIG